MHFTPPPDSLANSGVPGPYFWSLMWTADVSKTFSVIMVLARTKLLTWL